MPLATMHKQLAWTVCGLLVSAGAAVYATCSMQSNMWMLLGCFNKVHHVPLCTRQYAINIRVSLGLLEGTEAAIVHPAECSH